MNADPHRSRLLRLPLAGALCLFAAAQASAVAITGLEVGHVGSASATATWVVDDPAAIPSGQLFLDAGMTQPVSAPVVWEWQPLPELGLPELPGDYDQRAAARRVRAAMRQRGRVLARVSGLAPATTYHLRALALDPATGAVAAAAGPVAFRTAAATRLITESRQLLVTVESLPPEGVEGALVRVHAAGSPYPLFATLLDDAGTAVAVADLTALLDADGVTQRAPVGGLALTISLPDLPIDPLDAVVTYDGSFVVAAHTPVLFAGAQEVARFQFDPIPTQRRGVPFTITIRAVDAGGRLVTGFNERVTLGASRPLALGGGTTPAFTGGMLVGHTVRIDQTGIYALKAEDAAGRIGFSNPFSVLQLYRTLTLAADPPEGGLVMGAGEHVDGSTAAILAVAASGYLFVRWEGEGVADPASAATTVLMTADRALAAIFQSESVLTYAQWLSRHFGAAADDPAVAGLDRDPDGDGVVNLLEYAFGRSPTMPEDAYRMPRVRLDADGQVFLHYYRRAGQRSLGYQIQVKHHLAEAAWRVLTPAPGTVTVLPEEDGIEEVMVLVPAGEGSFLRVLVTK